MATSKVTRENAINHIADVFRLYGYDGASLSVISKATGLGRASLYHHFPGGKDEMAREAFKALGAQVEAQTLVPLRGDGSPQQKLKRWIGGVSNFYDGGRKNCILGAMVLSGGSDRFAKELSGTFRVLIDSLGKVLTDAGIPRGVAQQRAESAVGQIQGALLVSRGLGDVTHFQRVLKALPTQLLAEK